MENVCLILGRSKALDFNEGVMEAVRVITKRDQAAHSHHYLGANPIAWRFGCASASEGDLSSSLFPAFTTSTSMSSRVTYDIVHTSRS